jgi:hypothetical protein
LCLTPLSAIFQLYHGNQFWWWKKPERITDHGKATGKLYHFIDVYEMIALSCDLDNYFKESKLPY